MKIIEVLQQRALLNAKVKKTEEKLAREKDKLRVFERVHFGVTDGDIINIHEVVGLIVRCFNSLKETEKGKAKKK